MAEYGSENGFVVLDAAIMLLSADLAARIGGTFWRAKRSSSAAAAVPLLLVPCDARLGFPDLVVGCGAAPEVAEGACACVCSDVRELSTVIMSNPGSLGRVSGYDEAEADDVTAILPSLTGLRRARLRACRGGGEGKLKELDVDRLALTADRPSETLSDIIPANLVVANSLTTYTAASADTHRRTGRGGRQKNHARIKLVLVDIDADANINDIKVLVFHLQELVLLYLLLIFPRRHHLHRGTLLLRRNDSNLGRGGCCTTPRLQPESAPLVHLSSAFEFGDEHRFWRWYRYVCGDSGRDLLLLLFLARRRPGRHRRCARRAHSTRHRARHSARGCARHSHRRVTIPIPIRLKRYRL